MKRRISAWNLAASAGVLAAALLYTHILSGLGGLLVHTDPPQKADIVLVLDGDATGQRILTAAELARAGYATNVLVSGSDDFYGQYSCDLAIPFAVRHGYPEAAFLHLEHSAHSTQEEARVAVAWLRQHGIHRVLLVTSDYHTRRASRIFRAQAPEILFITEAAPDKFFTPDGWWHNREGKKTFLLEWAKTVSGLVGM